MRAAALGYTNTMMRIVSLVLFATLTACAALTPKFTALQSARVAYALAGEGPVTIVFESGLGDGMDTWKPVFDQISSFAATFAYDRPGYGRSEDVSGSSTGRDIVDRLRAVLARINVDPPYVLVGHSLGGQVVELFARLYPEDVVGVVLVDSRHSEFTERCHARLDGGCDLPGVMKLLMPGHMKRELDGASETADQIRQAPPFPDIELVVLSRSKGNESAEWLELWAETQREYTRLSSQVSHIVAPESGHYVHRDDPQAVIAAVRGVVERLHR